MKKIYAFIFICFCILTVNVSAATTDSLKMYENREALSYGKYKDFAPALDVVPEENEYVDTMGGSLTITETDLVLPGKNGLDLTISRKFNNQTTSTRYRYSENTENMYIYIPAYLYTYTDPLTNNTKYVYLAFSSEKQMLDGYGDTVYLISNYMTGTGFYYLEDLTYNNVDVPVYKRSAALKSSSDGTIVATRVKTESSKKTRIRIDSYVNTTDIDNTRYAIGYNWELLIPQYNGLSASQYAGGTSYYYKEWLGEFKTETGATYSVLHQLEHRNGAASTVFSSQDIIIENAGEMYTGTLDYVNGASVPTVLAHGVSQKYHKTITDKYGKTYFFLASRIVAIKDRFNNTIHYTYDANNKLSYITDSMGRKVYFDYDGSDIAAIRVIENDVLVQKITYTRKAYNITSMEPENKLYYGNYYNLTVTKWENSSQAELTTVYRHTRREILQYWDTNGNSLEKTVPNIVYTLDRITYPNGLVTNYTYELVEKYMPKGRVEAYRLIERKDTVNSVTKNKYTYAYTATTQAREGMKNYNADYEDVTFTGSVTRTDGLVRTDTYDKSYILKSSVTTATDYYYSETYGYQTEADRTPIRALTMQKFESGGDSTYVTFNAYDAAGNLTEHLEGPYQERS